MKTLPLYELKKVKTDFPCQKITSAQDAANFIKNFYGDDIEIFESVFLLLLNQANNTIGYAKISQGGIAGSVVDIRIICKYTVESLSTGVIIAHNHPSGNKKPSESDINQTQKVKNALKIMDITLLDHIIITKDDFYSFQDENKL